MFSYTKGRKYGNKKVYIDGILFDSMREGRRYRELEILRSAGEIQDLKLQVKFLLQEGFRDIQKCWHRPITYYADFVYLDKKYNWCLVVEDAKGFKTEVFKIKKKLLLNKYKDIIFVES